MKEMILAAFVAIGVTAGIASAGIASLANGAAILINATAAQTHSTPHVAMDVDTAPSWHAFPVQFWTQPDQRLGRSYAESIDISILPPAAEIARRNLSPFGINGLRQGIQLIATPSAPDRRKNG